MLETLSLYQVDAFTDQLYRGNPAAVVPLETWLSDTEMLHIAVENNLSETAFFVAKKPGYYEIRWFSPIKEIDFCGHATLASAFVLFRLSLELDQLVFWAQAVGELIVTRKG